MENPHPLWRGAAYGLAFTAILWASGVGVVVVAWRVLVAGD